MKNKQEKGLFKPEVYEAMQQTLNGPSKYRSAEEAFEMFYADKDLQNFLREYAKKEGIIEREIKKYELGYGIPKFSQAGMDRSILLVSDSQKRLDLKSQFGVLFEGLYIGPRQNKNAALIIYTTLGQIRPLSHLGLASGEIYKNNNGWQINTLSTYCWGKFFPVSQAPFFTRINKNLILRGLEKVISELTK